MSALTWTDIGIWNEKKAEDSLKTEKCWLPNMSILKSRTSVHQKKTTPKKVERISYKLERLLENIHPTEVSKI